MALAPNPPLRSLALVLFYGYVLLLIAAGAWGIVGARVDLPWLLGVHLEALPDRARADLLSQYRFLRAMELAFGLFALRFRREIFTAGVHNGLFLFGMGAGVVARLWSLAADGRPSILMLLFLGWELVGVCVIAVTTRMARQEDGRWRTTRAQRLGPTRANGVR
ncbi:DUF4345 family protein [Egicoccus sp. AB-alg6-2]|uniref:DUF4345 family protein n=1 Tax=Egicoccus sp. AB-alg6-2 TaxID=3242692 RepID=UPI00359D47AE